jgi:hypothetical protein
VSDKKTKVGGAKASPRSDKKPGYEAVDAPFDDIIDAILGANPEAIRDHRATRKPKKSKIP